MAEEKVIAEETAEEKPAKKVAKKAAPKKDAEEKKAAPAKKTVKKDEAPKAPKASSKPENKVVRIRLKSYEHSLIDAACEKIVDAAKRSNCTISGPIPLPTKKEIITILRAVHKYKDSREQFELRTHKRLIDLISPSKAAIEAIMSLELPAGVEIDIKL